MTALTMLDFTEWLAAADNSRTGDPLWSVQAYRLALYAIDSHTFDRRVNPRLAKASALDQVTRAIGSVAANIAEGYSRSSLADRNRFYVLRSDQRARRSRGTIRSESNSTKSRTSVRPFSFKCDVFY